MSELADQCRKSVPVKAASRPDLHLTEPGVSCDFCIGTKFKAVKSCLVCQTSHCETHLEAHQRVPSLKKHKLIDPVENLEDRMCKKHERPLELFCRTDQMYVCQFCTEGEHKTHDTVPLEQEYEERMKKMQQMIKERLEKVQEIKLSVDSSKGDTERKISDSKEVFTALVRSIEAEFIEAIEEKQKAAEKRAEGFIKDLEKEITELKSRSAELEQLSHTDTDDHFQLLQSFSFLSTPHTKDLSEISVHSDLCVGIVRRAVSQLEDALNTEMEKLAKVELKRIKQYAVDVTLDPDTANHWLVLSEDWKKVRHGDIRKKLPDNQKRFDNASDVLGRQSFSSGRFYYEVQVGRKDWDLGVVRESINRRGHRALKTEDGYWAIFVRDGTVYNAMAVPLSLREKPRKVGVFVDYEEGQVSFYDVEAGSHIYSYTGCTFTEKLYPYFSPAEFQGLYDYLVITPVNL